MISFLTVPVVAYISKRVGQHLGQSVRRVVFKRSRAEEFMAKTDVAGIYTYSD